MFQRVCACVRACAAAKAPIIYHGAYGVGCLSEAASQLKASGGLSCLRALDVRTRTPNEEARDLTQKSKMRLAERLQYHDEPAGLAGPPSCTDMGTLNSGTVISRMDRGTHTRSIRVANAPQIRMPARPPPSCKIDTCSQTESRICPVVEVCRVAFN